MQTKTGLYFLFFLSILILNGCVSYGNYPKVESFESKKEYPHLKYTLSGTKGWGGGSRSLEETLKLEGNFKSIEKLGTNLETNLETKEETGLFINAKTHAIAPSIPAMAFGYASYATATFLPFWSTQDGYEITFEVYNDGKRLKNYNYSSNRRTFVWMPMIVLVWVNYFTPSEKDVFAAITRQFLIDAEPVLNSI